MYKRQELDRLRLVVDFRVVPLVERLELPFPDRLEGLFLERLDAPLRLLPDREDLDVEVDIIRSFPEIRK